MDELIRKVNVYPNGTILVVKWGSGLVIKGEIDTIYETNNCLEEDDPKYQEYYACAVKILTICALPATFAGNIMEGELIEVSMQDPPQIIMLGDNQKIVFGE